MLKLVHGMSAGHVPTGCYQDHYYGHVFHMCTPEAVMGGRCPGKVCTGCSGHKGASTEMCPLGTSGVRHSVTAACHSPSAVRPADDLGPLWGLCGSAAR